MCVDQDTLLIPMGFVFKVLITVFSMPQMVHAIFAIYSKSTTIILKCVNKVFLVDGRFYIISFCN